jgi:cytochrome c oxidase cbb3-type subunit I/II
METQKFSYDNSIVRAFLYAMVVFGVVGFLVGLIVASLLFFPELPEHLFGTDDPTVSVNSNIMGLGKNTRRIWFR